MPKYVPMTPLEWFEVRLEGHANIRTFQATPGRTCQLCEKQFVEGEKSVLFPFLPEDPEETEKMNAGKPYISVAKEVHFRHLVDLVRDVFPALYSEWSR